MPFFWRGREKELFCRKPLSFGKIGIFTKFFDTREGKVNFLAYYMSNEQTHDSEQGSKVTWTKSNFIIQSIFTSFQLRTQNSKYRSWTYFCISLRWDSLRFNKPSPALETMHCLWEGTSNSMLTVTGARTFIGVQPFELLRLAFAVGIGACLQPLCSRCMGFSTTYVISTVKQEKCEQNIISTFREKSAEVDIS